MTPLRRVITYAVGDIHSRRIVWLIRTYCRVFGVGPGQWRNLETLK